jgi:hypothetical protein
MGNQASGAAMNRQAQSAGPLIEYYPKQKFKYSEGTKTKKNKTLTGPIDWNSPAADGAEFTELISKDGY